MRERTGQARAEALGIPLVLEPNAESGR